MKTQPRLDEDAVRAQALAQLDGFCTRILPGTLRRIIRWKRLPQQSLPELQDEVRQELAVDCLQHGAQLVLLPDACRHSRWMRLAERFIYRTFVTRVPTTPVTEDLPAPAMGGFVASEPHLPRFDRLANGRANKAGTARRLGLSTRGLRRQLDAIAEQVGQGPTQHVFWQARLAEALTGLASDLLRDRHALHVLPRQRPCPDPAGRWRRLRRLAGRFPIQPATLRERSVLRRWRKLPLHDPSAPRRLLQNAVALAPHDCAGWLWLFEACLLDGDAAAAAMALRKCRHHAPPTVLASTLARARLAEVRGALARARGILQRAVRRWPRDTELACVQQQVEANLAGPP